MIVKKRGMVVGLSWTGEPNRERDSFFSFFFLSLVYKWKLITRISCLDWLMFFVRTKRVELRSFAYANGHYQETGCESGAIDRNDDSSGGREEGGRERRGEFVLA